MFEISEELPDGTLEDKLIRPIFLFFPVVLPETAFGALLPVRAGTRRGSHG